MLQGVFPNRVIGRNQRAAQAFGRFQSRARRFKKHVGDNLDGLPAGLAAAGRAAHPIGDDNQVNAVLFIQHVIHGILIFRAYQTRIGQMGYMNRVTHDVGGQKAVHNDSAFVKPEQANQYIEIRQD